VDNLFKIYKFLSDEFLKQQMKEYLIFNFPFWNDKSPKIQLHVYQKCILQVLKGRKDNKLIHKIFHSFLFESIIKAEFPIEFTHFEFSFHETPIHLFHLLRLIYQSGHLLLVFYVQGLIL
jgi:hypothetical protein